MPWKGKVVFSQALLWSASFAESLLRIREIILEEAVKPVANRNKLKRNCFLTNFDGYFTSFSTIFQSYQDSGWVKMNGHVQ